jgi:asparagine synthase (glutamine-hydrolysing)
MRRSLAGILSLGRPVPDAASRARSAAGGAEGGCVSAGPLTLAWSGPPPRGDRSLCLVDGELDGPGDDEALALAAIRDAGHAGLERLAGNFALVAWDEPVGRGLLARDHAGARSLFWTLRPEALYFASELAPLLAMLPARPAPCRRALLEWLASEPVSGDATLYDGVHRLLPGHLLPLGTSRPVPRPYWTPRYEEPFPEDRAEVVERIRAELGTLVGRSTPPGGTSGVLLSAGLDSTAIAAIALRRRKGEVRGYSAGFPAFPELDESEQVARFAGEAGLAGCRVEAGGEGLLRGGIDHILRWGVPPVGWADFWEQPLLGRAAAEGAARVVSGDGGDEVFGLRPHLLADLARRGRLREMRRLVRRVPGAAYTPDSARLFLYAAEYGFRAGLPHRMHSLALPGRGSTRPWLTPASNALLRASVDRWAWQRLDGPLWWRSLAHLLTQRLESLGVLDHMRRRLEWAGLAGRHPFLNRQAFELALRLPPGLSFDARLNRPLLRDALAGTLPDHLRLRADKSRFDRMVIANLEDDLDAIRRLICAPRAELGAYTAPDAVARLVERGPGGHPAGTFVWAQEVLRLVMAEVWLREQAAPGFASTARLGFSEARLQTGELVPAGSAWAVFRP